MLCQIARQAGLRVIATADARDVEAVHGLGAQEVIDYRADPLEDAVNSIDAVIDLVGGEVQARSFAVLRPGGILVSAVSEPDQEIATRHGVRALFFLVNVTTAHLRRIAAMIDAGNLAVNVATPGKAPSSDTAVTVHHLAVLAIAQAQQYEDLSQEVDELRARVNALRPMVH